MSDGYRLTLLGERDLRGPDGSRVASVLAQPKRFCLLSYLVLAKRPVARSEITALFWPDSDEGKARNNLDQHLNKLRKSLGQRAIESLAGRDIGVPEGLFTSDLGELLSSDDPSAEVRERAAERVFGGWNAEDSQPLQEWIDGLRRQATARAEELATEDEANRQKNAPPAAPRRNLLPWPAAIPVVAGLLLIVFLGQRDRTPAEGAEVPPIEIVAPDDPERPPYIVVLLPEIGGVDARPHPSPQGLMFQLVDELNAATTLDVQFLEPEDPGAFTRSLVAIGEGRARHVRTIVTVGRSYVRINAAFVESGSPLAFFNDLLEYSDEDDLMLELPGRIAARVAQMVVEDGLPSVGLESTIVR